MKNKTVIVDVDGTIADKGNRDPFDESLVLQDKPHHDIIGLVELFQDQGATIVIVTGRTAKAKADTATWIAQHSRIKPVAIHTRANGDFRKDALVKQDIFHQHIKDVLPPVAFVLDDRQQVVDTWRDLGLRVLQVAPGNF